MKNLDWLFEVAPPFREAVCQAAADWLGSTSLNFAGAWLMEQHKYEHHDSDYEDLRGQHLDDGPCVVSDSRYATLREHAADQAEQLRRLTDECAELRKVAERYKADSVAAQSDADAWREKCGALLDAAHEMVRIGGDA